MSIDCMNPWPRISIIGLFAATSGSLPNSMTSRTTMLGRVVADVGELLGAHVADVAAQRRQHQREPLGDAAGIDAGAVQRRRCPRGTRPASAATPGVSRGIDPADRRHDVLARLEQPDDVARARRAPASRRRRRRRARRSRRGCSSPSRRSGRCSQISPTSRPTLSSLCTQHPTSSSSGWASTPLIASLPTNPVAH